MSTRYAGTVCAHKTRKCSFLARLVAVSLLNPVWVLVYLELVRPPDVLWARARDMWARSALS